MPIVKHVHLITSAVFNTNAEGTLKTVPTNRDALFHLKR